MDLAGKVVAITGAYKGFGAALAKAFAKRNCKLVLAARNKEELERFAKGIDTKVGVLPVVADVQKYGDCKRIVDDAVGKFGRIDIFINNAAVWYGNALQKTGQKEIKELFSANVLGMMYCSKFALRQMKRQKDGIIVNMASTSALWYTSEAAYGATKYAVLGFTGSLAEEAKAIGVKVVCFCPGGMASNLFRSKDAKQKEAELTYMDTDIVAEHLIKQIETDNPNWLLVMVRKRESLEKMIGVAKGTIKALGDAAVYGSAPQNE